MDALQQLPTHGDGIFDMRGLVRTLLETMASEIMDAQVGMACEDGATTCNGYRERGWPPPSAHRAPHLHVAHGDVFPGGAFSR